MFIVLDNIKILCEKWAQYIVDRKDFIKSQDERLNCIYGQKKAKKVNWSFVFILQATLPFKSERGGAVTVRLEKIPLSPLITLSR